MLSGSGMLGGGDLTIINKFHQPGRCTYTQSGLLVLQEAHLVIHLHVLGELEFEWLDK